MRPLSREAQAFIDAARAAGAPSDADHARVRRKLKVRLGGGLAAASTAAIAAKTAAAEAGATAAIGAGLLTKAGVAVVVLGVLAGGGAALSRGSASGARAADPVRGGVEAVAVAAVRAAPRPSPAPSTPAAPSAIAAREPPPPAQPAPARRFEAPPEDPPAPPAAAPRPALTSEFNEEVTLLSKAQGALSSGRADQALALLDEHAAAHREGAMREERAAARVFALCALGRHDEARAEAQRFVLEAPRSPLVSRVRAACAAGDRVAPDP